MKRLVLFFAIAASIGLRRDANAAEWLEGYLSQSAQTSEFYLNPLSSSQMTIVILNPNELKKLLKKNDYLGPARLQLKIIKPLSSDLRAQARVVKVDVSEGFRAAKTRLPRYDRRFRKLASE